MVKKYRKKPVTIEAVQWAGKNPSEITAFCNVDGIVAVFHDAVSDRYPERLVLQTLEGPMFASVGDYIIKGVNGEYYPCKPEIFEKTYDSLNYPCETCYYYEDIDDGLPECGYFGGKPNNPEDDCILWVSKDGNTTALSLETEKEE